MKKSLFFISIILMLFLFCSLPLTAYAESDDVEEASDGSVVENVPTADGGESFDWSAWFKEKVMPILISLSIGIAAICSFLYPVLRAVNGGIKLFKKSKGMFDEVTQKVVETQEEITDFKSTSLLKISEVATEMRESIQTITAHNKDELDDIKEKTTEVLLSHESKLEALKRQVENVVSITKIGFCHNKELVVNGYANEIMKVGVEHEDTQIKTEDTAINNS